MDPWTRKATVPAKMGTAPPAISLLQEALRREGIGTASSSLIRSVDYSEAAAYSPTQTVNSTVSVPAIPTLARPMPVTQPQPSEKFLKLQELRKKCHSRSECTYVKKRGSKRGMQCQRLSVFGELRCSQHLQTRNMSKASRPQAIRSESLKPVRINRLPKNSRYFFVKILEQTTVVLRRGSDLFRLKLPFGMEHPIAPTKYHYLIRTGTGKGLTEWRKAPSCAPSVV